jgi:hypothetical protein
VTTTIEKTAPENFDDYVAELRAEVCSRCIERKPGAPPCAPQGKACGIELHVPELVQMCRSAESAQMAPYIDQLHDVICEHCSAKDGPTCPCPLDYLLQLAVEAIEKVEARRRAAANSASTADFT